MFRMAHHLHWSLVLQGRALQQGSDPPLVNPHTEDLMQHVD